MNETAEIARFIRERGITRIPPRFVAPSPQGQLDGKAAANKLAAYTVYHENAKLPEIVGFLGRHGRKAWSNGRQHKLDGAACSRAELIVAANAIRVPLGLLPYS